ncbi:30S ribosomal protein S9 [Candidatus Wolfebacteria bacterium RIFCSPHIGHO2_01_FULL_48_22]|uniref:Small ribosomal subunit protein uS9 n=2 Tax=Candidatus Wolfeibacteriota TaxID=1752735 RepID=A0A1F8DS49_9BACT|nr:MAG: 30S ribosomal protein S9 [Candidatus Wolfebacteria bacterium RIFCSPHIGHO2_01_FULL_48_22]OGM92275.1 MAG: 30S ribosomal protein S9 [Candidatus Wolfebacteria bacterium RIFCSPLOWO2_01_FULL_47_17b]
MTKTTVKKEKYTETVGRRKTAVARVRLSDAKKASSKGGIVVNEKKMQEYFPLATLQKKVQSPLEKTDLLDSFEISTHVQGGGFNAQAEAIRHGIARALVLLQPDLRKKLKKFGYLTRDARMVERKKYGLKKARRAPQWSKR